MKNFLKWILAIVGVVALLLAVLAIVLPKIIDPNNYKDEISAAVLKETGRDLNIGGEIKWSVFPSIGLELSDVTLSNRRGFGELPMLDIGEAGISVKFMPLLKHKVEVGKVSMSDASIHLSRKADGKNNWEDLGGAQTGGATAAPASKGGMDSFTISGIEISNAMVTLDDVGQTTELKAFDLKVSNIEPGRPFDLQGGFSLNLPTQELAGDVKFGGVIQPAETGKRFRVEGLELTFKGQQGAAGDTLALDVKVAANADMDLSKDQAVLSDFVLRLYDLTVSGGLTVSSLTAEPNFSGQLEVAVFNPKSLLKSLGMEVPVTADDKALTRLEANMKFAGTANSADMQNLSVVFDQSTFKGNLKIVNFENPKLSFDFEVDRLNLDDYFPPDDASAVGTSGGPAAAGGDTDLSVETFRGFTGGGNLRISRLVVAGLTATDVSMKMSSNGNSVRFAPINAGFYGGRHEGDITIDASGARPLLKANHGLSGVQAEGLLKDLAESARLRGTGDFSLRISTDLSNPQTVMQDLAGDINMNIVDGEIVGIDIADTIAAVQSVLGKQSEMLSESSEDQATSFAELTMSGVFDHGVLLSDDLIMQSPLIRATGKGSFDLVAETIDYTLKPVLLGKVAGKKLGNLEGVPVPVKLSGNLYEPDIKVDIVAALAESQKEKINQKADELVDKLLGGDEEGSSENADAAKTLLKGILGGKKDSGKKKEDGGGR